MAFKNRMDLHIHTDNSDDGQHSVMLMCEYAVRCGLRAVAITDHCECNLYKRDRYDRSIRQSYFEARKAKAVFSGKLIVLAGMELGQALQDVKAAEDALSANDYDFVIGSLHNVEGQEDFWKIDFKTHDARTLIDRYYSEILQLAKWGKFDSLAHITYPFRYINGVEHLEIDENDYSDAIREVLKVLAQNGKALEINVSGLRQPYGKTLPELRFVRMFKELGGEFITVGSDAHICKDVGADIEAGMQTAIDAGFDKITLFQNRQPLLIPIE